MEKFLVTGAGGFVGSHLCECLLKKGKSVIGLDLGLRYPKLKEYEKFHFIQDTIKNYEILQKAVDKVDVVCHLAGIAEPSQYVQSPLKVIDITAIAGIRVVEMCRLSGKLFFFTSTSEIYGKNTAIPFREDDDRVLGATSTKRWCYSTSKAIMEHYLDACAFNGDLNYVIVRLFNVYGTRLRGRVVSSFLNNFMAGKDVYVHGDGSQTRCFTYIDEVVDGFYQLMTTPKCYNQIFNVGNPTETTVLDLAQRMKNIGDFSAEIRYMKHEEFYGSSYEDIGRRVPDISKIQEYIGWAPKTSLDEGLTNIIEYAKAQVDAEISEETIQKNSENADLQVANI